MSCTEGMGMNNPIVFLPSEEFPFLKFWTKLAV